MVDPVCIKISVIITAFNETSMHLQQCLDSVLSQTLPSDAYEIILVDDNSTSSATRSVIQRYENPASPVKIIRHSENRGLNESRRSGVIAASGDYVVFVDGDDVLTTDAVESLRMQALRTGADVVIAHFFRWNEANQTYERLQIQGQPLPNDYVERMQALLSLKSSFTMCGRLLRRTLLTNAVFDMPARVLHEDIVTLSRVMFAAANVSAIDRHIYYYRWNPHSITSGLGDRHIAGIFLAINDWVEQAQRRGLLELLSPAIVRGAASLMNLAVNRAVYSSTDDLGYLLRILRKLWEKSRELAIPVAVNPPPPGMRLLDELFGSEATVPRSQVPQVFERFGVGLRPPQYDKLAVLADGLGPSDRARRLYNKIVIICQVDYHVRNAVPLLKLLRKRGFQCALLDNSGFVANGARCSGKEDRQGLLDEEYVPIARAPYGSDWLCTARLVVTYNDFNDDFREALAYRMLLGQRSVSMIEGINDFRRVDFDSPRYLPYRRCDTVFLAGQDDAQYFEDRTTYVIGLPVIERLAQKQPVFPAKHLAVLNVNFTYGALEDRRDAFVSAAKMSFEQVGWDWVITKHPMDKGELGGLPVSKQTQYELIDQGTVFVSRFATGILEALSSGKPVIYFNPHGEQVAKFTEPMGAFDIATTTNELIAALRRVETDLAAGIDFRARALPFLAHHAGYLADGQSAAERFVDAVVDIIESAPAPHTRLQQLFLDRQKSQRTDKSEGVGPRDFRAANEMSRNGQHEPALQLYLSLYKNRPLDIYAHNALWCARKLGYRNVCSVNDFERLGSGKWVCIERNSNVDN